jgi:hypothetical protein
MAVEAEFYAVVFSVVEIVAVLLGPDNVESSTWTRLESSLDGHTQFGPRVKATVETVVAD